MGQVLDLGILIVLLIPFGLLIWLPLLGRLWSAIVSYVVFGLILGLSIFMYFALSDTPGGTDLQFAQLYLWIAAIALAMVVLTFTTFRLRQKRIQAKS